MTFKQLFKIKYFDQNYFILHVFFWLHPQRPKFLFYSVSVIESCFGKFYLIPDFSNSIKPWTTFGLNQAVIVAFQVTVPGRVVDVACGVDHMVAMAKSLIWTRKHGETSDVMLAFFWLALCTPLIWQRGTACQTRLISWYPSFRSWR